MSEMEGLEARMVSMEEKLDKLLKLLEPVHAHAEWVDGLRSRLHRMGLVRNTPRVEVGPSQVSEPPRYLHVPYPQSEVGDGKVGPILPVPPIHE